MFSIFKKRSKIVSDINWLGIDIHSHILPGIDDGAKNLDDSTLYVNTLYNLGFEKLFFTPHIFQELYPNSRETIFPALEQVVKALGDNRFKLGAAAEYMVNSDFELSDNLLCLPNKHILIEMSYLSETPNIEQVIFELFVKGYKVILAHPERYNFYHKDIPRYLRLKEMGCLFQLNILSVVGYYNKSVKEAAEYLLSKNMYDLAGTDLHHNKHLMLLEKIVTDGQLHKIIGNYAFKNRELFG